MIALSNVTIQTWNGQATVPVLDDVSAFFGPKERVGILAAPGSGKSTIARLLSGVEPPNSGGVLRDGDISWPLGSAGFLHPELTGEMNVALIARTLGEDPLDVLTFCIELSRQEDGFRRKMKNYSPSVRAVLAFALSLSRQCDYYIADEKIAIGDGEDQERFAAMLDTRLQNAGLIFLSRNVRQLETICSRFFLLQDARLIEVDSIKTAEEMQKQGKTETAT